MVHIKEFKGRGKTTPHLAWLKACTHRYLFQKSWHGERCHTLCKALFSCCNTHSIQVKQGLFLTYKIKNPTWKWIEDSRLKEDSKDIVNTQMLIEIQQGGTGFLGKNILWMFKMATENRKENIYYINT